MSEVHDSLDNRNIEIKNVGICKYTIPFILKNGNGNYSTIAKITSGVKLDSKTKGAHLSRIIMVIDENLTNKQLTLEELGNITHILGREVGVDNAFFHLSFEIVFQTITPKSDLKTNICVPIEIAFEEKNQKMISSYITIKSNGAMLCPNSKAKSKYGAHSQKCDFYLTLKDHFSNINIKDYSLLINYSCSAPVYGIVRSSDEIYLTELAYDNPKFSEDAIRDLLIAVRKIYKKGTICAKLENYESIHQHNVVCEGELND